MIRPDGGSFGHRKEVDQEITLRNIRVFYGNEAVNEVGGNQEEKVGKAHMAQKLSWKQRNLRVLPGVTNSAKERSKRGKKSLNQNRTRGII